MLENTKSYSSDLQAAKRAVWVMDGNFIDWPIVIVTARVVHAGN